jgi:putative death-receptor fusion protein DUF2428
MIGILSARPEGTLFHRAIEDLANISANPSTEHTYGDSLPQVHALNCLRSIFTTASLGDRSEPYVTGVLGLAGECLASATWVIRNCGLMLFRALIDRLLGHGDHPSSVQLTGVSRTSWTGTKGLEKSVLILLDKPVTNMYSPAEAVESVFPALNIVQRIPPPQLLRPKIRDIVLRLVQSSHWHLREMAARTYFSLVGENDVHSTIHTLLHDCTDLKAQNKLHGRLLCVYYIVKRKVSHSVERSLGLWQ